MATKKSTGFVREYLERVSWRVLERHRLIIRDMTKHHAGVYALYKADSLYYVGLASNLMGRVKAHLKDRHEGKWDRFSVYLTVDDGHIRPLEALVLRIAKPSGNRVKGRLSKALDLVRKLKREIEERVKDETASLLGGRFVSRRRRSKTKAKKGTLVLQGLVDKRIALVARYKGEKYRATLRKDGRISYKRKLFDSPSAAAKMILSRTVNGWSFWYYKDPSGNWVPLGEIRK